jgi:hypothetical protein
MEIRQQGSVPVRGTGTSGTIRRKRARKGAARERERDWERRYLEDVQGGQARGRAHGGLQVVEDHHGAILQRRQVRREHRQEVRLGANLPTHDT